MVGLPVDPDGAFLLTPFDNCIVVYNPLQPSTPGNPLGANGLPVGNACRPMPDPDNDGWLSCPGATPPLPSGCDAAPNSLLNLTGCAARQQAVVEIALKCDVLPMCAGG